MSSIIDDLFTTVPQKLPINRKNALYMILHLTNPTAGLSTAKWPAPWQPEWPKLSSETILNVSLHTDVTTGGNYYLLELESIQQLFTTHPNQQIHLRIDEDYVETLAGKTKGALACAHITLVCQNDNTWIKIHAYFNSLGKYLYCSAYQGEGIYSMKSKSTVLALDKEMQASIQEQSFNAIAKPLKILLKAKANGREALRQWVDTCWKKLLENSFDITNPIERKTFLTQAYSLHSAIEKINEYNELAEGYGNQFLLNRITQIENWTETPILEETISLEDLPSEKIPSVTKVPAIHAKVDKDEECLSNSKVLLVALKKLDSLLQPQQYLKALNIKHQLQWLKLIDPPLSNSKKIQTMERKISNALKEIPDPLTVFHHCLESDNTTIDDLQSLLPHIQGINPSDLFNKFFHILKCIDIKKPLLSKKQIEFFDFLLDNCNAYKQFLHYLSISTHQTSDEGKQISYSILAVLGMHFQIDAFTMLLRHGMDPNRSFCVLGDKYIHITRLAAIFKPTLMTLLLEHGAMIDPFRKSHVKIQGIPYLQDWWASLLKPTTAVSSSTLNAPQRFFIRELGEEYLLHPESEAVLSFPQVFEAIYPATCDLQAAILHNPFLSLATKLIEDSSLISLVLSLASITQLNGQKLIWFTNSAHSGVYSDNVVMLDTDKKHRGYSFQHDASIDLSVLTTISTDAKNDHTQEKISLLSPHADGTKTCFLYLTERPGLAENILAISNQFKTHYAGISMDKKELLLKALENITKTVKKQNPDLAIQVYFAILITLSFNHTVDLTSSRRMLWAAEKLFGLLLADFMPHLEFLFRFLYHSPYLKELTQEKAFDKLDTHLLNPNINELISTIEAHDFMAALRKKAAILDLSSSKLLP